MAVEHIILALLWIGFSFLHSLLAASSLKERAKQLMQEKYKFYRISYSVFAVITLTTVLVYHFTMESVYLWNPHLAERIIAAGGMISGGWVMILFSRKFFFDLSGADIFRNTRSHQQLLKTDFYKYVRHPLYAATLFFVWSFFFLQPLLSNLVSCACITVYTLIGIHFEEKKLVSEFGESYLQYRSKTPMLIPGLF